MMGMTTGFTAPHCALCGTRAYWASDQGVWRHRSTHPDGEVSPLIDGSAFCEKYGYPIEVVWHEPALAPRLVTTHDPHGGVKK
jgi:hypothetical protein